ncbi:MAG: SpoIID/LytB domain-containing protein [Candidatus Moranbacteria bacterium]|nr:SpoIID/LytB domain-containing protein [Candidatus Moranbacteria bacterium]
MNTEKSICLLLIIITASWFFFFSSSANAASPSPIYRFWSDANQSHFYTASLEEKNHVIATYPTNVWKYESVAFYAFLNKDTGLAPVYRFWSDANQSHFYTASATEKNHVINNYPDNVWKYEGIAYYAYPSQQDNTTNVFRFWSDTNQSHFYTATPNEKNCVINRYPENVWKYEGTAWWVLNTGINLADDPTVCQAGPNIRVGVWSHVRDDIRSSGEPFKIDANKNYVIKKADGAKVATVNASHQTRVIYESDGNLQVYSNDAGIPLTNVGYKVIFEAADGVNGNMIFDAHRPPIPSAEYDDYNNYRGKIELRYTNSSKNSAIYGDGITKRIWVINELPLEQYVWGMAELNLANVAEHNKVMVTIFRTYGKSKTEITTYYDALGFDLLSTPSSQKYNGYDYEISRLAIRNAAIATNGKIVTYKGKTALTAYSSWSDGNTRALDLELYPYLKPVKDPYGNYNGDYWDNPYKSTEELMALGNHMKGLIANGSVTLAYDLKWDWQRILKYYYTGIDITSAY